MALTVLTTSLQSPAKDTCLLVDVTGWVLKLGVQGTHLGRGQGLAVQKQPEGGGVCFRGVHRIEPESAAEAPLLIW